MLGLGRCCNPVTATTFASRRLIMSSYSGAVQKHAKLVKRVKKPDSGHLCCNQEGKLSSL